MAVLRRSLGGPASQRGGRNAESNAAQSAYAPCAPRKSARRATRAERALAKRTYWQDNLRLVALCLAIWFSVSFGFGILLLDPLNQIKIAGVGLGFWFAQQGSDLRLCAVDLLLRLAHGRARPQARRGRGLSVDLQTLTYLRRRRDLRALHRDRGLASQGAHDRRVLRRGQGVHPDRQRHGDRCRLDVGGIVHLDGGADRLPRLRRLGLPDGLDGGLRAAGAAARALPAQVRQVHRAGLRRRPLLRPSRRAVVAVVLRSCSSRSPTSRDRCAEWGWCSQPLPRTSTSIARAS